MEALLATALLVGVMLGALVVLSRTWPRTFGRGGYRARLRDQGEAEPPAGGEPPVPEDDDARWRWRSGRRED